MKYLFDTCVISELVSKQPSARLILVTRNVNNIDAANIKVLNPWD
jgi:predicted nucleic acid-binding protein